MSSETDKSDNNRWGVLGGTFAPFHEGHLHAAKAAMRHCGLQGVILMPVFSPPHRQVPSNHSFDDRLTALQQIALQHQWIEVSDIECTLEGPTYTVDALTALSTLHPNRKWTLIVGSDQWRKFGQWHNITQLLEKCDVAVVPRDHMALPQPTDILEDDHGTWYDRNQNCWVTASGSHIDFLTDDPVEISSTQIRQRGNETTL